MTALTASRANRLRAEMIISGALPATKRPGGKALARTVARQKSIDPASSWEAWRAYGAKFAHATKVSPWVAAELAISFADLKSKDLRARIEALEARLEGKAEPAARAPQKPLSLKLMRDIDDKVSDKIISQLRAAKDRDVKLSIMSPGGLVGPAQRVADAIVKHGRCDTHSFVNASSAALLVLAAGRNRSALKGCRFLLHAPTLTGGREPTAEDKRSLSRCARDMARFLSQRTNTPTSQYLKLMTPEGHTIDAGEASLMNLVNTVVRRPHQPRKDKK